MIGARVKIVDRTSSVKRAAARANFKNLGHAIATVRRTAIRSIKRSKKAGPAGKPPRTRKRRLPKSIFFAAERDGLSAIAGPIYSRVGLVGEAHEKGLEYMGQDFEERPFMSTAMEEEADRMPSYWLHSVGK